MLESSTNGVGVAVEAAGADRATPEGVPGAGDVPNPELVERATRRKFTAKYKLEILEKADVCTEPGQIGELLRREGLYTSHLTYWRKQRKDGALAELGKSRGRRPADRRDQEMAALKRRLERSEAELAKARKVIEIQGNLSALLEQMLSTEGASEPGSIER
jgi:transposase